MTKPEEYFHQLTTEIPEVASGNMFGAACMKTSNGKSAAMFWKECIVVKLHGPAFDEALRLKGACLFEPMEGRPMKEWVQIPYAHKAKWKKFALASAELVKELKKKTAAKKR
ncbi:MAG TPA: hypothetical protein VMM58_08185 [Bacteroidota bacterium]|nr:hypothetical protein [Bacteroidota bacterium]